MTNKNTTTTETTTTTKTMDPRNGVHAVMKNITTGEIRAVSAKTRTELAKALQENHEGFEVIQVYKGKQLNVKEKVSFSFN